MEEVVLFCLSYVLIFIVYQIFIINPAKRRYMRKTKGKHSKDPLEVRYLINKYNLDMNKIKYEQLLQICGLVSSLDISIAVLLISLTKNFLLELFVGFFSIVVLIFISYYLVYLFYKKKGMIKDGKHK